ncbi:MAG: hypothetical protein ACQESR_18315 [Planctomycetota bacterium]
MDKDFVERFARSLSRLPETDVRLERIPPGFPIATGYDDDVMLVVVRVGDPAATADAILPLITMAESAFVLEEFARTHGLIRKRIPIDTAQRVRDTLTSVGTEVEFVRPISD